MIEIFSSNITLHRILCADVKFIKASLWGHNGMKDKFAGGSRHLASNLTIEGYEKLASSDHRIVGFTSDSVYAKFYTYLGGTASPISESWPTYIREDLFNPSWKEGSFLQIGISKPHSMYFICLRKSDSDIWHKLIIKKSSGCRYD